MIERIKTVQKALEARGFEPRGSRNCPWEYAVYKPELDLAWTAEIDDDYEYRLVVTIRRCRWAEMHVTIATVRLLLTKAAEAESIGSAIAAAMDAVEVPR